MCDMMRVAVSDGECRLCKEPSSTRFGQTLVSRKLIDQAGFSVIHYHINTVMILQNFVQSKNDKENRAKMKRRMKTRNSSGQNREQT